MFSPTTENHPLVPFRVLKLSPEAIFLKICVINFIFFSGCTKAVSPLVKQTRICLGTIVEITVADRDKSPQFVNGAIKEAFTEIERIDDLLSRFKPKSDISRINADAYKRMTKVSPETINLIEKSVTFSRLSNGAFDISIYPLLEIWGLTGNPVFDIPTAEELTEAMDKVGYQNIDIIKQQQSIFLGRPAMKLDLGGIAKGYAVDKAIAVLKRTGLNNALVNAGGDIYCLGRRSETEKWAVAVQDPRKPEGILTTLEIEGRAVATSGDYQKYVEINGKRYSHIINPKSGYPCTDLPASVTVLAKDCLRADALATSTFVLGPQRGMDLINQLKDTEAILISAKGEGLDILSSRGLENNLLQLSAP